MKKLIYNIALIASATVLLSSCNDFLNTENYTEKNTSNYPQTLDDAEQVIAGIYNNLNVAQATPYETFLFNSEVASDDRLGGGGTTDYAMQAEDLMLNYGSSMYEQFWTDRYAGINRANTAIETLGNCSGYDSDDQKNQMLGEAYFLRGYYYYELASMFENIPLVVTSATSNIPQSAPADTWAQIISDFKTAADLMPDKTFGSGWVETGHADHWAAEGMLARAFLFYTGFYGDQESTTITSVTLPDGTSLTKDDVITYIDDCVNNSGYSLVPDFRNLWAYTNRLTVEDYDYTKDQDLEWVEDDNAVNPESMFAIKFSEFASWSTTIGYSNQYALYFGIRGGQTLKNTFPFGQGWGAGPVAPNLWSDWKKAEPDDMRRKASICNIPDEIPSYTYGGWTDFVQETDYYSKKWSPITAIVDSSYIVSFDVEMYNYTDQYTNMQLCNIHDLVLLRFADILLMQSELEESITGINLVRARAGLDAISSYSDEALRNERRWELNGEGIRWNDMRRYGKTYCEKYLAEQSGQACYYKGVASTNTTTNNGGGYVSRYEETRGFCPIPETEISISNGVLVQNEGWGTAANNYVGWK